jgi:magnesium chelatase family protein
MLAKRIPSILPDMTREEQIECSRIYSIMGLLKGEEGLLKQRPFRSPHHTSSDVSLIGGGSNAKPGEVSLAHNGVLFLDEMPEFKKSVLEVLRQPMNDGVIHISRANAYASYPARFMMVAAMNPCPCGYSGDPEKHCCCSHEQILRYRSRISGPIMDRIDLQLYSPRVKIQDLNRRGESSNQIRKRVQKARMIQQDRFKDAGIYANAQMESIQLRDFCKLTDNAAEELNRAVEQYGFSNRGYTKVLKIARTIADLDEKESIAQEHICEAIYLRTMAESI